MNAVTQVLEFKEKLDLKNALNEKLIGERDTLEQQLTAANLEAQMQLDEITELKNQLAAMQREAKRQDDKLEKAQNQIKQLNRDLARKDKMIDLKSGELRNKSKALGTEIKAHNHTRLAVNNLDRHAENMGEYLAACVGSLEQCYDQLDESLAETEHNKAVIMQMIPELLAVESGPNRTVQDHYNRQINEQAGK